jgi:hypothetical protein
MKHIKYISKWIMFIAGLCIGNRVYGSRFDDGVSWRYPDE